MKYELLKCEVIELELDDYDNYEETRNFKVGEIIKSKNHKYLLLEILECSPMYNLGIRVKLKVRRVV